MRLLPALTAIAVTGLLAATPASAQDADFYKGKTINLIVGFTPGGGYDIYARLLARHLPRHIPGTPTIIVENMPSAGSLTAVRHLDGAALKDGTVMTTFNPGMLIQSLTTPDKIPLKFSDYAWIGSITRDFRVCYAWGATGVKNWDDMMKRKEFILGSTAKGSGNYINGAELRQIFNAPVRQILGFPGSAEQRLAIENGELDGDCGSWNSIPENYIRDNRINTFVRFSEIRYPDIPANVPWVGEFAKTDEQKTLLAMLGASDEVGRPYVMSKQVPAERVAIMRTAFDETMKDQAFLDEAQKQRLSISPATAAECEAIVNKISQASPDLVAKAKAIYE
jgi:tripartite-type tricarboxylate transporter receptor subunit TctC